MFSSASPTQTPPVWAQPGVTDVAAARAFLQLLRREDVLFYHSGDDEPGATVNWLTSAARGLGFTLSRQIVAAAEPSRDLWEYHRRLGLGPEEVWVPRASRSRPLMAACLEDEEMLSRLRVDASIRALFTRYTSDRSEALAARLGVPFTGGARGPANCASLNDKASLAEAGRRHGFATLDARLVFTLEELDAAFEELHREHGAGCMLRDRQGAGGSGLVHAPTLACARRVFGGMVGGDGVLVTPFIPQDRVIRNLSLHGVVAQDGFAPLVLTDQILKGYTYRGSRCVGELPPEHIRAVRACLPGLGRWLLAEGYIHAPAGVDGFLLRSADGPRFVVIDPNIRLTNTIRPWSVVAALSEKAGCTFEWELEWMSFIGPRVDLALLRQRLGRDLLHESRLDEGGVLPGYMGWLGVGLGVTRMEMLFLARGEAHLAHLRRRVTELGMRWS
jgi:hypothetical protein